MTPKPTTAFVASVGGRQPTWRQRPPKSAHSVAHLWNQRRRQARGVRAAPIHRVQLAKKLIGQTKARTTPNTNRCGCALPVQVCPQCGKRLPASFSSQVCGVTALRISAVRGLPKSSPAKPKDHAYHAMQRPFWRCADCAQAMLSDVPNQSLGSRRRRRDQTPPVHSVQNVVPSAPYAKNPCSAARIHTAGATGVPFRRVQLAVVDRARAEAEETKTNIMPNSCRSGRARRASYHKVDRPNAGRSNWPSKHTPCHRCRRRRSHLRTESQPGRRPLANPKRRKTHLARPPPRTRCSAPAEATVRSPAAVSFGQPKTRRSSSAWSFSLPAESRKSMHLEESQPVLIDPPEKTDTEFAAPATQCPSQRAAELSFSLSRRLFSRQCRCIRFSLHACRDTACSQGPCCSFGNLKPGSKSTSMQYPVGCFEDSSDNRLQPGRCPG